MYKGAVCRYHQSSLIVGIFCLFHTDGRPVDEALARRMVGALALRGLDEKAMRCKGSLAIAARDVFACNTITVAADARIDNRFDLFKILGLSSREKDITDAELIFHAYERWGKECPAKLIGDFSFIIHDASSDSIFCARDHIGIRPFYYHYRGNLFAVATEIKALLEHPDISSAPDEQRIGDYLISFFDDPAITFYADVRRLPPAHVMVIKDNRRDIHRYASLDPVRELRLASDADYSAAFLELFTETVRCRTGGTAIGAALSGGLDSSSVACIAANVLMTREQGPLQTFSAVYARPEADERRYMEAVVARGGMEPHYIIADELNPFQDVEQRRARLDEPYFSPNFYIHWRLFREASACGADVWLDGLDGDTTVSHGTAFLAELARSGRWLTMRREAGALADRAGSSRARVLRRAVVNPLVLGPLRRAWHEVNGRSLRPWGERSIVRDDFAAGINLAERYNAGIGAQPATRTLRQEHHRRIEWGLHTFILEMLDKAAATFGIVPRYPFYDRRLIEFCLSLPPTQKLHDGWTRAVLRRAMEGVLPPEVRLRTTKGDPGASFFIALRRHGGPLMSRVLAGESGGLGNYVDLVRLRAIHERFMRDAAQGEEIMELWKGVTLGIWLGG